MANIIINNLRYYLYMKQNTDDILDRDSDSSYLAYVTVAFNQPKYIEYQIRLINKFESNSYHHWILDNSSDKQYSEDIRNICCKSSNVSYVRIPQERKWYKNSMSHAMALNWFIKNILTYKKYSYSIFLDHDIFPITKITFYQRLEEQGIYGVYQERINSGMTYWYLWPGLCGLSNQYLKNLDFRGTKWGDTGSSSFETIRPETIEFSQESVFRMTDGVREYAEKPDEWRKDAERFLEEAVEIYDDEWIHMVNGSNWANRSINKKQEYLYQYMDALLK